MFDLTCLFFFSKAARSPEEAPGVGQVRQRLLQGPGLPWGQRGSRRGPRAAPAPCVPLFGLTLGIAAQSSALGLKPHSSTGPGQRGWGLTGYDV